MNSAQSRDWDVFLSYRRADRHHLALLVPALTRQGLRVFVDDTAVDDFGSITDTIIRALAHAKVLLAVYSADYPRRRACEWELTYAYLAGQREGDPRRRVLVVNPEPTAGHVHPVELRDARHWPVPRTPDAADALAARVAAHCAGLAAPMGSAAAPAPPAWLPAPARSGSSRFTGRLHEQWRLHTALHRHRAPLVAPAGDGRTAQLRGMTGIGKSLLAQEYALRFGAAFTGGVFWFDLHDCPAGDRDTALETYRTQVATVVEALGLDASGALPALVSRLAIRPAERDEPCLWVVDGVPDGLSARDLELLRGPRLTTATLFTTRSARYGTFAEPVDLAPLADTDAYTLLTSRRAPDTPHEEAAARALLTDLGGHPQALDLLAERSLSNSYTRLRARLHSSGADALTLWNATAAPATFPGLNTASPPASDPARSRTDDVLRLLAVASPTPLTHTLMERTLAALGGHDTWRIPRDVAEAIDLLTGDGVIQPATTSDGAWALHPLTARAARLHDTDAGRQEDLRRALLTTLAQHAERPILATSATVPAGEEPTMRSTAPSPSQAERGAAFDLQVELVTRVGVQPLAPGQGSLREALTSLHSLISTARQALHRASTDPASSPALPRIATTLTNDVLRPYLATWHTALQLHEATRPDGTGVIEHERAWDRAEEMRAALADLRDPLVAVVEDLAELSGTRLLP